MLWKSTIFIKIITFSKSKGGTNVLRNQSFLGHLKIKDFWCARKAELF
jgi:hypothetical protein